jgi:hypothetical protein
MPLHDWIHKYPQVAALLQQPDDPLLYLPDGFRSDDVPPNDALLRAALGSYPCRSYSDHSALPSNPRISAWSSKRP